MLTLRELAEQLLRKTGGDAMAALKLLERKQPKLARRKAACAIAERYYALGYAKLATPAEH
jgi:hypothetical protein